MLETRLTKLLGCQYPIVQTAMGWVADPKLVSASCNAGAIGFLAGATIPADKVEANIQELKSLTDRPFGINFHMYQANAEDIVDLVVSYKVAAVSYSRSPGKDMIRRLKKADVVCMPTVGLPKHALKAVELGADAVTIQGAEGGGHTGAIPTTLLLPRVVDLVGKDVPIIAAGGFRDGRGLVSALANGADGIAMGTRFMMTKDSPTPHETLDRYLSCDNPAEIVVSRAIDGIPQRMILNEMLSTLEEAGIFKKWVIAIKSGLAYRKFTGLTVMEVFRSALKMNLESDLTVVQSIMAANAPMIIQRAMVDGDPANGVLPSGQVAGVIDELLSCEDLVKGIVSEAEQILAEFALRASSE